MVAAATRIEIIARPKVTLVENLAVLYPDGPQHRISLSFGCGDALPRVINDTPVFLNKAVDISSPACVQNLGWRGAPVLGEWVVIHGAGKRHSR